MDFVAKTVLAVFIGFAALAGTQFVGLWSVKRFLGGEASKGLPVMKPAYNFEQSKIGTTLMPKMPPIDTSAGQRAAISAANRQIDLAIHAGQNVPQPRHFPGMPRF